MEQERWEFVSFEEAVDICDSQRKPINNKERSKRIEGKRLNELFPYYGATGQVGFIDDFITDGEYVLLGEDGAPFLNSFAKKAYVISGKTWVNNHAHVLRSKTNNKFLCYYLNYFNYKGYVSGTTRLKLTQTDMRRIPIPNPSVSEQEHIVARIEELFSELDKAVETLNTTKEQLAVYRQAVLKEAFEVASKKKVELSEIVEEIKIGPFGTMLHKRDYIVDGIPVINPQHIKNGVIVPNSNNSISVEKGNELKAYVLHENDIVMGRRGEMGRAAAVTMHEEGWICGTGSILLRLKPSFDSLFYAQVLSSPEVIHYLNEQATGTTMKNLNEKIVEHILVPCISRKLQKQVKNVVDMKITVCDSIEQTVNTALQQAEAMRQSILKQAFEGSLV